MKIKFNGVDLSEEIQHGFRFSQTLDRNEVDVHSAVKNGDQIVLRTILKIIPDENRYKNFRCWFKYTYWESEIQFDGTVVEIICESN